MSALADDIEFLQAQADAAGLILYTADKSPSYPNPAQAFVRPETLGAFAVEMDRRRLTPREYRLIDYEAVWLMKTAQQLALHRADGNLQKAERFQKLGEYLRAAVEVDLVNARKSLEAI
jgi:hypothetical protein